MKVRIVLVQPQLPQKEGVCWHADSDLADLAFNLLAKLILHLKGRFEDTKGLDLMSVRCDDNGCTIIERFQD